MKLYTYWRSSAAYRIRIALALKNIDHENLFVHLVKDGGEQLKADYEAINPQNLVPSLVLADGNILTQSMAILEYLDETFPEPALLPATALERAHVRALSQTIASDIHPLDNLRVLTYLTKELKVDPDDKMAWYRHWIELGFAGFEKLLSRSNISGPYCHGNTPTMADICLVPQVYNARRFEMDLSPYPTIQRIEEACLKLSAFDTATPENQEDAQI